MKKTATRLSICMIVKNEESNLPALLESIAPVGAELIVVDTGSTDRTREIALAGGAKVVRWTWNSDFAAARNVSLTHATRPWILWLDGDDRLPPESVEPLRHLAEGTPDRAWTFTVRNAEGSHGSGGSFFSQLRMFPNHPRIRFVGAIHEQVYPAISRLGLPCGYAPVCIIHTGYTDPELVLAKQQRNKEILRHRISNGDGGALAYYQLGAAEVSTGEAAAGEVSFRRSMELLRAGDPDKPLFSIVPSSIAQAVLMLRGPEEAWKALQENIVGDPSSWHPSQTAQWAKLATTFSGPEQGLEFWEKAFEPEQSNSHIPIDTLASCHEPLETIANFWKKRGNVSLAVAVLRLLKAVHKGDRIRRHELPQQYLANGEAARAAELFAWCIEKDAEDAASWAGLVKALRTSGEDGAADQFLAEGRRRLPAAPELAGAV